MKNVLLIAFCLILSACSSSEPASEGHSEIRSVSFKEKPVLRGRALKGGGAQLSWTDGEPGIKEFFIECDSSKGFEICGSVPWSQYKFIYASDKPSGKILFRIQAKNGKQVSPYSDSVELDVQPVEDPPEAPSELILDKATDTSLFLAWTRNSENESLFSVEAQGPADSMFKEVTTTKNAEVYVELKDLAADTSYALRVRARNSAGDSEFSEVLQAKTLPMSSPSPTPTATPSASPSPTPTATPSASPSPAPTETPSASPSPTPTATPSASPSPTPTATPSTSPTPTPTATPSASPTPTPTSAPYISSFSPISGPVGTPVTIFGSQLRSIYFGSVQAMILSSAAAGVVVNVPAGAQTGSITAYNAAESYTTKDFFTVGIALTPTPTPTSTPSPTSSPTPVPTPWISGLSPSSGPVGTYTIVSGSNLENIKEASVGGILATVSANSSTSVTVKVPSNGVTGFIHLSSARGSADSRSSFMVIPSSPSILGLTPSFGKPGTVVSVSGVNLGGVSAAMACGVSVTPTLITPISLQITIPATAPVGPCTVTVAYTSQYVDSKISFTVLSDAPSISGFSPISGLPGSSVTIKGYNLTAATAATLGGSTATISSRTNESLSVTVPAGATTGKFSLSWAGGKVPSSDDFIVLAPPPVINSIFPTSGPVGTDVTIEGTGLDKVSSVSIGGMPASNVNFLSAKKIVARVAQGATTGTIQLSNLTQKATSSQVFTVSPPDPVIVGFSPASGAVGSDVTIDFKYSGVISSVSIGGTPAGFQLLSTSRIRAVVPAGAASGPIDIFANIQSAKSSTNFEVLSAPVITKFSPSSGTVGTSVTIEGTNLNGSTSVRVCGITMTVHSSSSTKIIATIPAGAKEGPIAITTPGGTGKSAADFSTTYLPEITGISPSSAPPGTAITISGKNFSGLQSVSVGNVIVSTFSVTDTAIETYIPFDASNGVVQVKTSSGLGKSPSNITVKKAVKPKITELTPWKGPVGIQVTISGTNLAPLGSNNEVKFGTVTATIVSTSKTGTEIVVIVPKGAKTHLVHIYTSAGDDASPKLFTVKKE